MQHLFKRGYTIALVEETDTKNVYIVLVSL